MSRYTISYRLPDNLKGTILHDIVKSKIAETIVAKSKWPGSSIRDALERAAAVRSLSRALLARPPAIIAEIKKASPSAGILRPEMDPVKIATEYQQNGAAAVSVVTEGRFFRGRLESIAVLRLEARVPLLRKDFLFDPWQLLESRHAGADAVLLIAALFDTGSLKEMVNETANLGMEALVEVHNEAELERALAAGAAIVGVNNRDLRSFGVSLEISLNLAAKIPPGIVAVAESGIRAPGDVRRLSEAGYRGMLVGETLLRSTSPGEALRQLIGGPALRKVS